MGSITDYLEAELLDHVFNVAYVPAATIYLALCTADPTDAATGAVMNEVPDAGAYQRTAIAFSAAALRTVTQNGDVVFPQASGAWGTVTHWAIVDSQVHGAGNALAHGAFAVGKAIVAGNTPTVGDGEITVAFSAGEISDYLALELLDHAFRNAAYAKPATYVGLCTVVVTDADTGTTITEPAGFGYAREIVNINGGASPTWDLAAGDTPTVVDNTHQIDFGPAAGGAWGTIVAVAICDALTLGNLLFYDNAMADQAVADGDDVNFPIGDLDVQMS